jgi:murein DD-endopeptidase MepM/ murein hydrolase activator NlpD
MARLFFSRYICLLGAVCLSGCAAVYVDNSYIPPFSQNKKFIVSQAFMGTKTHNNPVNYYAVDLVMPLGEAVCAARSGKVVDLHDSSRTPDEADEADETADFVRIMEESGRINDYQHLLPGSINISIGQHINVRECFAKVGNTGISTGPHLHFAVLNSSLQSVPFRFLQPGGSLIEPAYLEWVRN